MKTLTRRPYQGESDLPRIVDLINTCAIADDIIDSTTSINELQIEFGSPLVNPERDICLWEDIDGKLIGFAELWIPESSQTQRGSLWFNVHPSIRDRDLETEILMWAERLMQKISQERGVTVNLQVPVRETLTDRVTLLKRHGFGPVRYFYRMERSLADPIPKPQFPDGFILRSMNRIEDAQAWVDLYNQSFIDHWNHHEMTLEECRYWMNHNPVYRPELDLVAIAPDGTFAAFCYSEIDPEYNARIGQRLGAVHLLGTRRGFRRMGLGRAMLLSALHRLQKAGMETTRLGVDTENPLGAKQLYESVGFKQVLTSIVFEKE
ncbi:GNAT family N-acetyltransferase [Leptothermofonsia sp. ETS-13]|uniref:GNAT family N-acetyltransferase n=1 Tax=Leptothermofonsia sp. ETS-13 TaxID=3035696 RepID=UPI003B9F57F4